ncbi:hypothetical protein ASNO1_62710 [Corallococcus caeni]|uniref:Uncharacterized protein n=1 Tax=Corallococcus caeni TaxID=3082388 RepID=A0ABQ6R131_9BACT|nr:hypothetical protein ASNO1_62710 [Corallococcus sp. NO1]
MVQRHEQHVLVLGELQERGTQQRAPGEVEGAQRFRCSEPLRFRLTRVLGEVLQVHPFQDEVHGRVDVLDGLARVRVEGGAQGLVTVDERVEGSLQGGDVSRTLQAQRVRHVVRGRSGLELIEEPQALLREGQRQLSRARYRDEGRSLKPGRAGPGVIDVTREARQGRGFEDGAQGQLHIESRAHAGHELRGQQRVTAQFEEVVSGAHSGMAQHLGPEGRELLLGRCARGDVRGGGGGFRNGEGLAVDLAVGGEGQGLQEDEGGGHHVLGQPLLQVFAE